MVAVFDAGGQTGSPASDPERGPAVGDAAARAFVLDGAQPVQVATAEVIANPSNTVLQGTLIQASLETAIDIRRIDPPYTLCAKRVDALEF